MTKGAPRMTTAVCPKCQWAQTIQGNPNATGEGMSCLVCGSPLPGGALVAPAMPPARAPQAKLLFIDDDKLVLGLFRDFALTHGFLPRIATDAPSGIALAKLERPDLIILDVTSPRVDGLEVCRRLRAEPDLQDLPILLITALEDPTIFAKGVQAGATLTITKILDPHRFLLTIKTLLGPTFHRPSTC